MFELKPDFEAVRNRYEAWWDGQVLDRPLVSMTFPRPEAECVAPPRKRHATLRERWMDTGHTVALAEARLRNTVHFADSLPVAWPNLGPEIFSAFYGCDMEYGEQTAWSRPVLADWSDESVARLRLDRASFYFRKLEEMTEALVEAGKGKFIVGYTDLHGGGDAMAAFRGPQELLVDTLEHPEAMKRLCDRLTGEFLDVYDHFHGILSAAGMPSTTWLPATCRGKYHVPSNDFSCMISDEAFEDLFVPGIVREGRHMDRCMYHLDGPRALRYLDRLLELPEIHAIQWVPGAGQGAWTDWIEVYRRIQGKKKALCLSLPAGDLDLLFRTLDPGGVWIQSVSGVTNEREAEAALREIAAWTRKR